MPNGSTLPEPVLDAYELDGAPIEKLSGGRTNRTMRVRAGRELVIQQMRGAAHDDLLGVMENLVRVTSHLDWKRRIAGTGPSWYPELVPTMAGKPFLFHGDDVWRAFGFRPGVIVRTPQPIETTRSIAALYGRFACETSDLGGPELIVTAPGFHDLATIHAAFSADLDRTEPARRDPAGPLSRRIAGLLVQVEDRAAQDGLADVPRRVVHNDTKFSNALLDREGGRAIAVLDLDLVMMGPGWHDVGDLVRSACWHRPGGEAPGIDPGLFRSMVGAYIEGAAQTLTPAEIATYATAGPRLALELGVRYLHDHLRDEPHLQVDPPDTPLRRAESNVNLAEEMLAAYDALRPIVDSYLRGDAEQGKDRE